MRRDDYLSLAQMARVTGIGLRTLFRYAKDPYLRKYRRKMPDGERYLWHRNVLPEIARRYLRGKMLQGRPNNRGKRGDS